MPTILLLALPPRIFTPYTARNCRSMIRSPNILLVVFSSYIACIKCLYLFRNLARREHYLSENEFERQENEYVNLKS